MLCCSDIIQEVILFVPFPYIYFKVTANSYGVWVSIRKPTKVKNQTMFQHINGYVICAKNRPQTENQPQHRKLCGAFAPTRRHAPIAHPLHSLTRRAIRAWIASAGGCIIHAAYARHLPELYPPLLFAIFNDCSPAHQSRRIPVSVPREL